MKAYVKVRSDGDVDCLLDRRRIGDDSSRRWQRAAMVEHRDVADFLLDGADRPLDLIFARDVALEVESGATSGCHVLGSRLLVGSLQVDTNHRRIESTKLQSEFTAEAA